MWKSYEILAEVPDGCGDADYGALSRRVSRWLALGWQSLGGLATAHVPFPSGEGGACYAQALVHTDANAARPQEQGA